jgi:hypothetical protein
VANVQIDPSRHIEFVRLYSAWKWEKEKRELPPNAMLASIGLPTPMDHVPGQLWYRDIETEFLDVLRSHKFPFTPI